MSPADDESEDYFLPLTDQRVFGAGIKRKRIAFVSASTTASDIPAVSQPASSDKRAAARYFDIVFPTTEADSELAGIKCETIVDNDTTADLPKTCACQVCLVCSQPIESGSTKHIQHQSSIRHQLAVPHMHPPSHLPRDHPGLKYLASYGWDPDSRTGLGAQSQGIRQPIKAHEKKDTHGLREKVNREEEGQVRKPGTTKVQNDDRNPMRLNAKQARLQALAGKKRTAQLRKSFYSRIEVEEYLGPGE